MNDQLGLFATPDPDHAAISLVGLKVYRGARSHVSSVEVTADIPWRQHRWHMYGQSGDRPRMEAWYHVDSTRGYKFGGGKPVMPVAFEDSPVVNRLREFAGRLTDEIFDSCFANRYRSGADHIDWHADDESWIGPVIVSMSFGASRVMRFRAKKYTGRRTSHAVTLHHGDVLVMPAGTQQAWEHCIARTARAVGERVNLTFRQTKGGGS